MALLGGFLLALGFTRDSTAQDSSITWDKPQTVERKVKPRRQYRPQPRRTARPKAETTPLLTVQYRLLKLRPQGTQLDIHPASQVFAGDMLRLAVTPNQEGFLYVIHQYEGEDGTILFPNTRVNDGQNFVAKNQEFLLPPGNCGAPDPRACWYKVSPSTKKEYFIVVFSRDLILDLPSQAAQAALASGGAVKSALIDEYVRTVNPQRDYVITGRPRGARIGTASPYAVWVINKNAKDNEEIVLRVPLNKGE
jgi:hypothetical protein